MGRGLEQTLVPRRHTALARWFSWLEHRPVHQKAAGSIPSQGTYLDCRFDPQVKHVWEATDQCFSH